MNQNDYITKTPKTYRHFTSFERGEIQALLKEGLTQSEIARRLQRSSSSISRELRRNRVIQRDSNWKETAVYFADTAQLLYEKRRVRSVKKYALTQCPELMEYIDQRILRDKWSPDAILGDLRNGSHTFCRLVSTKTVYNYIHYGLLKSKPVDLTLMVRRKTKPHHERRHKRLAGKSIEERPAEVNERLEFGHWEGDTVQGPKGTKEVLLTLTERKTKKEFIRKIPDKTAGSVKRALLNLLEEVGELSPKIFRSITVDNGPEFTGEEVSGDSQIPLLYYARPYSAWERGLNENHNGIIRRFLPKGKSFENLQENTIERIESWMNRLPRKGFRYQTPEQVFIREVEQLLIS